ncbi:hypothetical protein [uncultured Chitinophaga sp.]|uniref:hypothetical protein n=1 Tax=uncultured Chitinophaga sp. TaxID=339340 RepID=UPI0025F4EF13|nr:hypothetical protein [uncultured Chitinophaga sp.]
MNNNGEAFYLSQLLKQIGEVFDRGAASDWTPYDFNKLSDAIFERTDVRLSVTTLKRIFGRLKYDSAPTLSTLNTLAQFAGHADWLAFKSQPGEAVLETTVNIPLPPAKKPKWLWTSLAGSIILAACLLVIFQFAGKSRKAYTPAQFEFSANKMIAEGVPNSVVFNYTANAKPDSLFIVQTWDMSRKVQVPADKHAHSAIYYYPGFFKAKLIADTQVVKTQDIWITTAGWLCLLEEEPFPVYLPKKEYEQNGIIEVTDAMLAPYLHTSPVPKVRFFNQRDMGELMNDNFVFETTVKNTFDDGRNACHASQVLIQCKDDMIFIPLAAKSCVGDLSLYYCGTWIQSKSADLSGFGCDLTQWTTLRVEAVKGKVSIYVNDRPAYTLTFPNKPTAIVGVQYRFNGAAAVKDTRFTANGNAHEMK